MANRLAEPLRAEGLDVPVLTSFNGRPGGDVVVSLHLTADDEAADVARRARAFWDGSTVGRSVAVLVRNRSQIPRIEAALRAVELPVQVVGVGGLLATPEVADVVATLRVIADPERGDALMRLLTGARCASVHAISTLSPAGLAFSSTATMRRTPTLTRSTAAASSTHSTRCRGRLVLRRRRPSARRPVRRASRAAQTVRPAVADLVHDVERTSAWTWRSRPGSDPVGAPTWIASLTS